MSTENLIGTNALTSSEGLPNIHPFSPSLLTDDIIIQECEISKRDYLGMINDVHNLLENCENLSSKQKLDYCNSERHYMKEYLKYTLIKVNKCFPD